MTRRTHDARDGRVTNHARGVGLFVTRAAEHAAKRRKLGAEARLANDGLRGLGHVWILIAALTDCPTERRARSLCDFAKHSIRCGAFETASDECDATGQTIRVEAGLILDGAAVHVEIRIVDPHGTKHFRASLFGRAFVVGRQRARVIVFVASDRQYFCELAAVEPRAVRHADVDRNVGIVRRTRGGRARDCNPDTAAD